MEDNNLLDNRSQTQEMIPYVFDGLLEPVESFVAKQSENLPKHPGEKFFYADFFRMLVYYFVSSNKNSSIRLFMNLLKKGLIPEELNIPIIPRSTFNDAFSRFSPNLFRDVFLYLLSSLQLKHIPELAIFGTLYCIDGSLFPVISSMLWAEFQSNHNALRLHLCFELNRMIAVDFVVGSGNSSERDALREMLVPCVTYIADRGYMSFQIFYDILKIKSHFIFRVKSNLVYSILAELTVQLPAHTESLFQNAKDSLVSYDNDEHNITYRLVQFEIGKEKYLILTARVDLTTFQVIVLYAYRWQIELIFRFLKRTMNGIHLIKQDERGVTIQFYALLITALLELNLKQQVVSKVEEHNQIQDPPPNQAVESKTEESEQIQAPPPNHVEDFIEEKVLDSYQFFKMIGDPLKKYWKIGIHWLTELQLLLSKPFDDRAIKILGCTSAT